MPQNKHPNVILILGDEQHLSTVGCYGGTPVQTPHIDSIAAAGMRFDSAYCCASICSPSRAALFTGQLPHRFGTVVNDLTIPAGTPNLAGILSQTGYRLGYAGKWHVDKATVPTDHGFIGKNHPGYGMPTWMFENPITPQDMQKRRNPYYEYLVDNGLEVPRLEQQREAPGFAGQGVRIIDGLHSGPVEASIPWYIGSESVENIRTLARRRRNDGAPFFLWSNFWGPHNPCFIPEPYYSMYNPEEIAEPASFADSLKDKPALQRWFSDYWGMYEADWSCWQQHIARFMGYCTLIDDQVGRMLAALAETGELERTIVIYAADHGDALGRHRLMDKGPFMYDDTYRVPLVASGPDIIQGQTDEFVYLHDLFATILEATGSTDKHTATDSVSLMPLLTGQGTWNSRQKIFGEFDSQIIHCQQRMIRTRKHKFIYTPAAGSELYDLEHDPHEMINRIHDPAYAKIKTALKACLREHLKNTNDREYRKFALMERHRF